MGGTALNNAGERVQLAGSRRLLVVLARSTVAVLLLVSLPMMVAGGVPSSARLPASCFDGTYRSALGPWKTGCPGFSQCSPGFYCTDGARFPCPKGRYGKSYGLRSAQCDGLCDAGYFCVNTYNGSIQLMQGSSSATQNKCGNAAVYCPAGSSAPQKVKSGYYTIAPGSLSTTQAIRTDQRICEAGYYCKEGIKIQCPAGRFGSTEGLTTPACSGECQEGYYCPDGSVTATAVECRGTSIFCPAGSGKPSQVFAGADSAEGGSGAHIAVSAVGAAEHRQNVNEEACPVGNYCRDGVKRPCPAGRYGGTPGLTSDKCTGPCQGGYYCPEGSIIARAVACGGPGLYCPPSSPAPIPVSVGFYTTGGTSITRVSQQKCQIGRWCSGGEQFFCNPGHFGNQTGETDPNCSGPCESGYICPAGSTSPRQQECGSPDVFCPAGALKPQQVSVGFYSIRVTAGTVVVTTDGRDLTHPDSLAQFEPYTVNDWPPDTTGANAGIVASTVLTEIRLNTSAIRNSERQCEEGHYCLEGKILKCPAGRYGNARGVISPSCSGPCAAGYYCPEGSSRENQVPCGSAAVYCPGGSTQPTTATLGYYTVGGDDTTRSAQVQCPPGTYCERGIKISCPAGSYGAMPGLSTAACSGKCDAGYYCPAASTSPVQHACGDETVYCPAGSARPIAVDDGYYTAGGRNTLIPATQGMFCQAAYGNLLLASALVAPVSIAFDPLRYCTSGQIGDNSTRSTQVACEPGHFCVAGLRYECPPARYGSSPGLSEPQCTGPCPAGWYCGWASTSMFQFECGGVDRYCPDKSGAPTPVSPGYYTSPDRKPEIRTRQIICEPGHYCVGGLRYECPSRRYGSVPGLTNALCTGICAAGHYCPPASIQATQKECGAPQLYCPVGSEAPLDVATGYYTTGGYSQVIGQPQNTTRDWQEICPPGTYCETGVIRQCPAGVYGNTSGLSTPACTGVCPAGYFCPPGTVLPHTYPCGSLFINVTDGSGVTIPWEDTYRDKFPTVRKLILSTVATQSFLLEGGVSSVFCPQGSAFPTPVTSGYYSVGGSKDNMTRSDQLPCEKGYFCVAGRKFSCPPGTYGSERKLTSRYCSGWCPAGYYCPLASPEPIECPENSYSTGGFPACVACPSPPFTAPGPNGVVQPRCKDSRSCCNY